MPGYGEAMPEWLHKQITIRFQPINIWSGQMQNELQVLNNIEKNQKATQRDIARNTGLSLGNVNILIKRLVKKGLLKIEKLNARSIRYILTPEGIREKAKLTYEYIKISYNYINDINNKIEKLITGFKNNDISRIILFGENDEVYRLVRDKFDHSNIRYVHYETIDEMDKHIHERKCDDIPIIVWNTDSIDALRNMEIPFVNVLEKL